MAKRRRATLPYSRCVFVNCPFDRAFKPILDALLFAIHDCGFIARIALEDAGTGDARLEKIREIIEGSRFSIHDVSRTGTHALPRFNMPFECGMFFGAKMFGSSRHAAKDLLVLDRVPRRFKLTMSDLGGQDGLHHGNHPNKAIDCVRVFLARKNTHTNIPGAAYIQKRFKLFQAQLPEMARVARLTTRELKALDYLPDLLNLMVAWQKKVDRLANVNGRRDAALLNAPVRKAVSRRR
jgi:hypothetical protein